MDTGGQSVLETEQKYDVEAGFVVPDLTGPGVTLAEPETYQLAATYFDTADQRLLAARVTLRRRTGGADAGWHVKLPVSADTRRELHFPLDLGDGPVPARIAAEVARWTAGQPLRPVARLETRRTVRRLADAAGRVRAEVADDQVTGFRPAPARDQGDPGPGALAWQPAAAWREIEVELVAGDRALLDETGQRLRAAGATRSASASKLSRLIGPG